MVQRPVSAAEVQQALLSEFLPNRKDAVVFGAHAVNIHLPIDLVRFTHDIDLYAGEATKLAGEIARFLADRFGLKPVLHEYEDQYGHSGKSIRIAEPLPDGKEMRLVDVWQVFPFPPHEEIEGVQIITVAEAIAEKVMSCSDRKGLPQGFQDRADLGQLLIQHPEYKVEQGEVRQHLYAANASDEQLREWEAICRERQRKPRMWFPPERR